MKLINWLKKKLQIVKAKNHNYNLPQDQNLIDGLLLLKQKSNDCIDEILKYLNKVPEVSILVEISRLNNPIATTGTPEINKLFWEKVNQKLKSNNTVTGMLNNILENALNQENAILLSSWLEIYLKIDWDNGLKWCVFNSECDKIVSKYEKANPNNTERKCSLIFGLCNRNEISPIIFPLLMYIEDKPNSSLNSHIIDIVKNKLCKNATEKEIIVIEYLAQQILKALRKEVEDDYIDFVRKVVDIFNKNNPLDKLWRP